MNLNDSRSGKAGFGTDDERNCTVLTPGHHLAFRDDGIWLVRKADWQQRVMFAGDLVRIARQRRDDDMDALTILLDEMLIPEGAP